MTKFDAGSVLEPLDYDFTKFGGRKGTVPEPDEVVLTEFLRQLAEITNAIAKEHFDLPDDITREELFVKAQELTTKDILPELSAALTKLYSEVLCQGNPPVEELNRLPLRIRGEFFKWIVEQTRPEFFGAASTRRAPVLRAVNGAMSSI